MMQYKKLKDFTGNERDDVIYCVNNNTVIPFDPANTSYQEYLQWLDEGNTPEEAE